jgi:hypothetical protein
MLVGTLVLLVGLLAYDFSCIAQQVHPRAASELPHHAVKLLSALVGIGTCYGLIGNMMMMVHAVCSASLIIATLGFGIVSRDPFVAITNPFVSSLSSLGKFVKCVVCSMLPAVLLHMMMYVLSWVHAVFQFLLHSSLGTRTTRGCVLLAVYEAAVLSEQLAVARSVHQDHSQPA